ncbi:MAG: hypothetical protein ACPKM0_06905 [Pleomorphochaeta sp.]
MEIKKYLKFEDLPQSIIDIEASLPIFITSDYARMMSKTKKYEVSWYVGYENNIPLFIIPFGIKKILFFTKGICLFSSFCLDMNKYTHEVEQEFIDAMVLYIEKSKCCDWIQQSPNHALFSVIPSGSKSCPFGTFRVNILGTDEDILQQIRRDERRSIRKAEKEGGIIHFGEDYLDDAFKVIISTLSKAQLSTFSKSRVLEEKKILKDKFIVGVCYHNDIPQSAVIAYRTKHSVYAIYAGSIYKQLRGATNWLYYDIYKQGSACGAQYFDFVGARMHINKDSKLYRIQQFKRHMGGELIEGFLWKKVINKPKYFLYSILLGTRYLLKGKKMKGDIIDQEIKRLKL